MEKENYRKYNNWNMANRRAIWNLGVTSVYSVLFTVEPPRSFWSHSVHLRFSRTYLDNALLYILVQLPNVWAPGGTYLVYTEYF